MEHKLSVDWFKIQQLPKLAKSRILSLLCRNCCGSDIKVRSNPKQGLDLSRCDKIYSKRLVKKIGQMFC